jgi:hypothetical protein
MYPWRMIDCLTVPAVLVNGKNWKFHSSLVMSISSPKCMFVRSRGTEIYLITNSSCTILGKILFQIRRYIWKDIKLTKDLSGDFSEFITYVATKSLFKNGSKQFYAANYSPIFQLFPTESGVGTVALNNASTWEEIENYHEHRNLDDQDFEAHEITKMIASAIENLPKKDRILELGCGAGRNISYLAEIFPNTEVVGIDINAAANSVTRFPENVRFIQGDILEFDFEKLGNFDVVLTSGFLMHINHVDVKKVVARAAKISQSLLIWELHGQSHIWDYHRYPRDYAELFDNLGIEYSSYTNYLGHPVYSYELTPKFSHSLLIT